jgi:chemotaxis protein MotB
MIGKKAAVAAGISAIALILSGCETPPAPPPPQAAAPPPEVAAAGPPVRQSISERTLLTVADDLAFRSGGYTLTPEGRADLAHIVPDLKTMRNAKVVVYGYTDNVPVGPALQRRGIVDNRDLSSKRANAVVRYLEARGVNPNILSAKGRGETHPIASNDTPQGRAQNRRIEVVVEQPIS